MSRADFRAVFLGMIALGFWAPYVAIAVVSIAIAAQAALSFLHLLACTTSCAKSKVPCDHSEGGAVFFSVHVATHEEPAALVMRTVLALSRQVNAPPFEVIVLDNNTRDPSLWRPVQALCSQLGPQFRFFHEENVIGAKAGALNIALDRTDPRTSHVIIVDADYEVAPAFLTIAAQELAERDDDFIQFPQAYRDERNSASGISLELADYFQRHAFQANGADAMLLTGTLSVIRRTALQAAGGWSARTITEDAELGLRLRRLGYCGRLVDQIVGHGILPLSVDGLGQQRYRWAAGNVTTALTGFAGLPFAAAIHVASQLTAWANFALPMAGCLIGGSIALALGSQAQALQPLLTLAGLGLALVYLSAGLPLLLTSVVRGGLPLATVAAALAARLMLILPSSAGTIDAVLGRPGSFRRTAKHADAATPGVGVVLPLLAGLGGLLLVVPALPAGAVLGAVLLVLPYPLALLTQSRLATYCASLQST